MEIIIIVLSCLSLGIMIYVLILVSTVLRKTDADLSGFLKSKLDASFLSQRTELSSKMDSSLSIMKEMSSSEIGRITKQLDQKLEQISSRFDSISKQYEDRFIKLNEVVETSLKRIQEDNTSKLDQIRKTVDEKLQETLNARITSSFKEVSEKLESVHKGLGEMQSLSQRINDLQKTFNQPKTRGILGELQLSMLLEDVLTQDQYVSNCITKKGSNDRVEFAIKLPGKEHGTVLIPIDAKFPNEDYNSLIDAYNKNDIESIGRLRKSLEARVKAEAKSIHLKYIDPPHTTDFGLMYIPTEGLYSEIIRLPNLIETLHREFKIIITGPTTLAALLNSLQMGFRTLAIQKKSAEVWKILTGIKGDLSKYVTNLDKAKMKINDAYKSVDSAYTDSQKMQTKLSGIDNYKSEEEVLTVDADSGDKPSLYPET